VGVHRVPEPQYSYGRQQEADQYELRNMAFVKQPAGEQPGNNYGYCKKDEEHPDIRKILLRCVNAHKDNDRAVGDHDKEHAKGDGKGLLMKQAGKGEPLSRYLL